MAALNSVRDTSEIAQDAKYLSLPVKGKTTIYQGAPERLSKKAWATSVFSFKLPNPFPAFCHKVILTGRFFCRRFLRRVDRVKIYFIIHKTFPLLNFY